MAGKHTAHQITLILVNYNNSGFAYTCLKQPLEKKLEIAFASPSIKDNEKGTRSCSQLNRLQAESP